jgi:DNA-binding XRE family transcriptional regulator
MPKRESDNPPLFNRLTVVRTERGLSRRQLADAVGVHYQTIAYLERGEYNPSLVLALRIAAALDVPLAAVFALTPFPSMVDQLYQEDR